MGWADDFAEGFAAGFVPAYEKSFDQEVKRQDTLYESAIESWGETQAERAEAQREHAQRLRRAETVAQDLGVDTGLVFRQADTYGWDFAKTREAIEKRGVQRIGGNDTQTDAAMSESDTQGGSSEFDIETFRARMRQSESSGDTGAYRRNENGNAYGGLVQMGEARLKDYNNATGAGLTPESYRMMTEEAQREVENWHFRDINQRINSEGLDEYIGQTINGTRITRDSIVAMSHLGGFNGAKKYLESGGEQNPSDELGTSLSDYASKFGQPADEASAQTDEMLSGGQESSPGITREEALQYVNTGHSVVDQRIVNSLDQRGELEAFVQSARGDTSGMEVPETNFRLGSANNSDYDLSDFVGKTPPEIQQLMAVYGSSMTDEDRVVVNSIMEVAQQEENDSDWWRRPENVAEKSDDFLRRFVALTDDDEGRQVALTALESTASDDTPDSPKAAAFVEMWSSLPDDMSAEERGQAAMDFETTWESGTSQNSQLDIFSELADRDSVSELTALRTTINNNPAMEEDRDRLLGLVDTAIGNINNINSGDYDLDSYKSDVVQYTRDLTSGTDEERQAALEWFETEQPALKAGLQAAQEVENDLTSSALVEAGVPEDIASLVAVDGTDLRADRFGRMGVWNRYTGEAISGAATGTAGGDDEQSGVTGADIIPDPESTSTLSDPELQQQIDQETAALEETVGGEDVASFEQTLANIDVSTALGGPGMAQAGVNKFAALFGANAPFEENRRAANAMERLQRITSLTLAQSQANQRGSVALMNEFRQNAVAPNEIIGLDGALDKFRANYNLLNDQVQRLDRVRTGQVPATTADVSRAIQRGVPASDVVDKLLMQGGNRVQLNDQVFDVAAARQAGVDDREIAQILVTGEGWEQLPDGVMGGIDAFARGTNTGLSRVLGAPVDLMNNAPRALNVIPGVDDVGPISEYPIGGSESIRDALGFAGIQTYDDVSDLPPEMRPAARSGEVVGESIPLVGGAGAAARITRPATMSSSTTRRAVDTVLDPMRRSPGAAYSAEAASTVGAAQGAFLGTAIAPDNELVQAGFEILGGIASPVAVSRRLSRTMGNGVRRFTSTFMGDKKQIAADTLYNALRESGEDPEELSRVLREAADNPVEGIDLTAGQASGSPALLRLENRLAQRSDEFFGYRQDRIQGGLETLREGAAALAASGDPQALRLAGQMRQRYFDTLIRGRLAQASAEASQSARRFEGMDPRQASAAVRRIQDDALSDMRLIESSLWEEIPRETDVATDGVLSAYQNIRRGLLPEENAPDLVDGFVRRVSADADDVAEEGAAVSIDDLQPGSTTAGELVRFRSRMLSKARDAASQGNNDLARQYGEMAQGALDDLETIDLPQAQEARQFSRTLNQTFRTNNLEQIGRSTRTGADTVRPEETLERAVGGGGTPGDLNLEEMNQAARLADEQNAAVREVDTNYAGDTVANVEQFLRSRIDDLRNPETGEITSESIERFIQRNPDLVDRYPNLRDDMNTAAEAYRASQRAAEQADTARQAIDKKTMFGRLVNTEDPSRVVGDAVTSRRPDAQYGQLVRLAQREGQEAVDGLKAATMDYAFQSARNSNGDFSFGRFRNALVAPQSERGQSLMDRMISNGVMNNDEADRLIRIVDEMDRLEGVNSFSARAAGETVDPESGPVFDFAQRIVGSAVGQASLVGQASGASLVAAGAGVRATRSIMDKIPRARTMETLIEVAKDPQATADLLNRARTPVQRLAQEQRLNAFLLQQGIIDPTEDDTEYPSSLEDDPVRIRIEDSAGTMSEEETERMLRESETQQ